jgi:hypothetical protein
LEESRFFIIRSPGIAKCETPKSQKKEVNVADHVRNDRWKIMTRGMIRQQQVSS